MKPRFSSDVWVIIALVAFLLGFGYYATSRQVSDTGMEFLARRTTYSAKRHGLKALYETLDKLDYPVKRVLHPLTQRPDNGVLFIVTPEAPITKLEWRSLRAWVEEGNLLIVADDTYFSYEPGETLDKAQSSASGPSFLAPGVARYTTEKLADITDKTWSFGKQRMLSFDSDEDTPTPAVKGRPTGPSIPLAPLFHHGDNTTVAFSRCGKGELIVLSSAWSLSNDGIKADDNLILVLNAINHRDPSRKLTVAFDEFHHGYGSSPGIGSLIGPSARLGLLQLAMAFVLLVIAVGRRFGTPVYLREGTRSRSEYLGSMSALLRKAKALDIVRLELDRKFRSDVCSRLGLPKDYSDEDIIRVAEERYPSKAKELRALLHSNDAVDDKDFLTLQARRDQLRKELTNSK